MSGWNSEEDSKLLSLLSKGHSYQEIADMMFKSRSAIAGRVRRLRHKATPDVRKKLQRKVLTISAPTPELPPVAFNVPLLSLTPTSCRWPSDDKVDGQTMFCGLKALSGKPYCAHHHKKMKRNY